MGKRERPCDGQRDSESIHPCSVRHSQTPTHDRSDWNMARKHLFEKGHTYTKPKYAMRTKTSSRPLGLIAQVSVRPVAGPERSQPSKADHIVQRENLTRSSASYRDYRCKPCAPHFLSLIYLACQTT